MKNDDKDNLDAPERRRRASWVAFMLRFDKADANQEFFDQFKDCLFRKYRQKALRDLQFEHVLKPFAAPFNQYVLNCWAAAHCPISQENGKHISRWQHVDTSHARGVAQRS